jgi:hypothetical protein
MISDDLAQAVTDELNATTFSQAFVAQRLEVPEFSVPDLATLRVSVTDSGIVLEPASRTRHVHDVAIDIAVQARVADDQAAVRPLKALVQEILDHFRFWRPAAIAASLLRAEYLAHRFVEHLRDKRVFTGVVRLTYRVVR